MQLPFAHAADLALAWGAAVPCLLPLLNLILFYMLFLLSVNNSVRLSVKYLSLLAEYFFTNGYVLWVGDLVEGAAALATLLKTVVPSSTAEHGWLLRWAAHGTTAEAASATEIWIHFPEAVATAAALIGPYGPVFFLFLISTRHVTLRSRHVHFTEFSI